MMGERLVMQENLFYEFRLENMSRPITCCGASTASPTAPSCASIWQATTAPQAAPPSIPS
jgi:hypothetical protein